MPRTTRPNPSAKPEPVAKQTVCSQCGLDWNKHPKQPTLADCVALLKKELASRPQWNYFSGGTGVGIMPTYYQHTTAVN